MIEVGIPNLQYFLRKGGVGRSDEGVQAHGEIAGADSEFAKRDYLSVIIGNFRKNLIK